MHHVITRTLGAASAILTSAILMGGPGCTAERPLDRANAPSVSPATQPVAEAIPLDPAAVKPMYREMLSIDLPSVVAVATARNIDVKQAQERVEAARGRFESAWGSLFPVISPGFLFEHIDGSAKATQGNLLPANFNFVQPYLLIQAALNPGRVAYDIIAARKRLLAAEEEEQFALVDTLRASAVLYYDLVLAQIQLANAQQAVAEGEELLRITRVRTERGTGLPADQSRARASLAGRQQDLAIALNNFYQTSIKLAVTLHLEPSVTLIPKPEKLAPTRLVRDDLPIDDLLAIAVQWRPDLRAVRTLATAAGADAGSTTWGTLSPQLNAGYQFSGLTSDSSLGDFSLRDQNRATAGASWSFGFSTPGQIRTADSLVRQAGLEVQKHFDAVRAQVVRAAQESGTNSRLIPMAREQLSAAEESLRLTEANLRAGTMLALDALQAADAVNDARLRYARSVAAYNQSQVNLLAALGLIDAPRLNPTGPATRPAR